MIGVRLQSFTTYGFKSFADKTEIVFDKGITAVVGPNGAGKSNISDAIRWVLGEQSAKYLRGSKMEDVIFSGSSKRRALGLAEVTLTFDNTDHSLPLGFEHVSLTRRLFRSGESEYAINKKICRLKDIIDLMADTGLGKGSMSIISQNKIDEILNSRPEDRRSLFEEAAGIVKYRLRKKEAVKRLDNTALNLTRINDIRSEVDAQIAPLAQAAAKTKHFNELSEKLRLCRITILMHKLDALNATKASLQSKKVTAEKNFAVKATTLSSKQAESESLQQQLAELSEAYSNLQEEIREHENILTQLHGQQDVLTERASQSKKAIDRFKTSNTKLITQVQEFDKKMKQLIAEFNTANNERTQAVSQVTLLKENKEKQLKLLEDIKTRNDNAQSAYFSQMQELLQLRNQLQTLEKEQEQRVRRRDTLKKNLEECEQSASKSQEQYTSLLSEQARYSYDNQSIEKSINELRKQYEENKSEIKIVTAELQQCHNKLIQIEARLQSLQHLQQNYEGFGYGTKAVLMADRPWRQQILGVVAELIKTDAKYVIALETALGESSQNIVTKNSQTAKTCINFLKQTKNGRATFLPLDTIQKRSPSREEMALTNLPGIYGYAVNLIKFSPEIENAICFLLGRVLIAENIDSALNAAKRSRFRIRVVTIDGDVVNTGGSLTGGSRKHREGFFSRELEIQQLKTQSKELHGEILTWQEKLEQHEDLYKIQEKKLQSAIDQYQRLKLKLKEIDLNLQQLIQDQAKENKIIHTLLQERSNITKEYLSNRDKLKSLRIVVNDKENKDSKIKELLDNLRKSLAQQGSILTALDNQLQDAKILEQTSTAKSQYINERIQNLDNEILRLSTEFKNNQYEQKRYEQIITQCSNEKDTLIQKSSLIMNELQKILGGKENYINKRGKIIGSQHIIESEIEKLKKQTTTAESQLRQIELDLIRQSSDYDHITEQLREQYKLEEHEAKQIDMNPWKSLSLKALQTKENSLSLEIANLGPINASAIEEYMVIKERSEFLQHQAEDLSQAKNNLETVIGQIDLNMSKRFQEAFGKINTFFAQCYKKLFGGGTAFLRLSEPENILNSGIDIEAQPPGKKLQSLYLLSGGERALTVIALLFALLTYRPSPFCILDEIDAPLDDVNIQRFANFLKLYAVNTQFIVITHRKGTMECANIMYGVTMEESGVSKLLSVKINSKENE